MRVNILRTLAGLVEAVVRAYIPPGDRQNFAGAGPLARARPRMHARAPLFMDTVLLTSGYPSGTLAELRRHWNVIDIRSQEGALDHLRRKSAVLSAAVIGNAFPDGFVGGDLGAEEMLARLLERDRSLPIIISTRNRDPRMIVQLVRQGAFDYVIEPSDRTDPEEVFAYTQNLVLALRRAVHLRAVLRENEQLRRRDSADVAAPPQPWAEAPIPAPGGRLNYRQTMRQCERQLIARALRQSHNNITRAAEMLGLKRTTLRYRIRQLDLRRNVRGH